MKQNKNGSVRLAQRRTGRSANCSTWEGEQGRLSVGGGGPLIDGGESVSWRMLLYQMVTMHNVGGGLRPLMNVAREPQVCAEEGSKEQRQSHNHNGNVRSLCKFCIGY